MPRADKIAKKNQRMAREYADRQGFYLLEKIRAQAEALTDIPTRRGQHIIVDSCPGVSIIQRTLEEDKTQLDVFLILEFNKKLICKIIDFSFIQKPRTTGEVIESIYGSKDPEEIFAKITSERMEGK